MHQSIVRLLFFIIIMVNMSALQAKPSWVKGMENDQVNYFKLIKKFDRYWKKHFLPNQEEEEYHQSKDLKKEESDPRPLLVKLFQSEERAREKSNQLSIPYRQFNKWKMEMLPFVKSDGHLMSKEDRLKAWQELQKMSN